MIIEVDVSNKIAQVRDKTIAGVCGNSDYVVHFNFDDEWNAYENKTARFKWGGTFTDVVFTGNECPMPIIYDTNTLEIGVYAGELHTTTAAVLYMKKSVLCGNASESKESQEIKDNMNKILAEKVDVPQTASVGDVLTVEEVDDHGKPTKWKAATKKQANWEQNDSTAEDYVQGRTHWVEHDVLTEILPETTFEVTLEDGETQWWSDEISFSALWNIGDKAVVTVNGTEYESVVCVFEDCLVTGNSCVLNSSYEDTGEPYYVSIYDWSVDEGTQVGTICFNTSGRYTISIRACTTETHHINTSYIENMYGIMTDFWVVGNWDVASLNSVGAIENRRVSLSIGAKYYPDLELIATDSGAWFSCKAGKYDLQFNPSLGEVKVSDGLSSSDILVYGSENYTKTVPVKYLPVQNIADSVTYDLFSTLIQSGHLSEGVVLINWNPNNSPYIYTRDRPIMIKVGTSNGKAVEAKKVTIYYRGDSGTYDDGDTETYDIYSHKTGAVITNEEFPRSVMFLVASGGGYVCINSN